MYKHILTFYIISGLDLIPMVVTFVAGLALGLDYGMLIGISINLMFILYNSARPKVQVRSLTVSILLMCYKLHNVSNINHLINNHVNGWKALEHIQYYVHIDQTVARHHNVLDIRRLYLTYI